MALPAAAQVAGDKKGDPSPAKAAPKVTADTPVNGKTLDQWIAVIEKSKDRSLTELALQAIVMYPPDISKRAVPAMIAELKKHSSITPIDLSVRTNLPLPMAAILASQEKPDAQQVRDAVEVLRKMTQDTQVIVRFRAVQALGQLGPLAKDAVGELLKAVNEIQSPTWELRHAAVTALGTVCFEQKAGTPARKDVVNALLSLHGVHDLALKVRLASLNSLHVLRVAETEAYKKDLQRELEKMAKDDPDPLCKLRANLALYPLHTTADEKKHRAKVVGDYLDNSDHLLRAEAAHAIGQMGPDARDQVPRLLKSLKDTRDKDLVVMDVLIWALGQMGKDGQSALADLNTVSNDATMPQEIRDHAKEAVDSILGIKTKPKEEPKKGGKLR